MMPAPELRAEDPGVGTPSLHSSSDPIAAVNGPAWLTGEPNLTSPMADLAARPAGLDGSRIRQLPPEPPTLSLLLSALGSFGAWHLARSARKWHFADVPNWYHTGGPEQIGHSLALVPGLEVEPACRDTRPPDLERHLPHFIRAEARPCCRPGLLVAAKPARGPPLRD
jgi:hypothetical protein